MSSAVDAVDAGLDVGEDGIPGLDEGGNTIGFQLVGDGLEVDTQLGELGHDGVGLFVGALDGRSAVAVVGESVQGLLRHGVHDERSDELVNVDAIGVSRVLGAGGSPQRTLLLGALGLESGPTRIVGELVLEQFVSETSVGDGGLAFESLGLVGADLLELLVDGGIHTGNEEGGDGTDVVQIVAVGVSLGDALDEGVDDLLVALEREDQGDVDGDALGQGGGDCRQAFEGCRNLDHGVRTVDLLPELDSLLLGGFGLVGQTRIHLDGDAAVNEIGGFGDLTEDVGGVAYVGGASLMAWLGFTTLFWVSGGLFIISALWIGFKLK